jgi:hypothetical protein
MVTRGAYHLPHHGPEEENAQHPSDRLSQHRFLVSRVTGVSVGYFIGEISFDVVCYGSE